MTIKPNTDAEILSITQHKIAGGRVECATIMGNGTYSETRISLIGYDYMDSHYRPMKTTVQHTRYVRVYRSGSVTGNYETREEAVNGLTQYLIDHGVVIGTLTYETEE